jgi:hypothetical protein
MRIIKIEGMRKSEKKGRKHSMLYVQERKRPQRERKTKE